MIIVLPAVARLLLEPHLPADAEIRWFTSPDEAASMAADAEIGWLDLQPPALTGRAIAAGEKLKWVSTIYAGLDAFPLDRLVERGTVLTNGVGINTVAVAEYAVMGILAAAKDFPEVVRAQERREWLRDSPGKVELSESRALVIGYGAIGRAIGERLAGFGVAVTGVRRTPGEESDMLGPEGWRDRIGEFDWIVIAAPATGNTSHMFGAEELTAMKPTAWLVNIARGSLVDQDALVAALAARRIGGAFLDVTDPEPLPVDHPLWATPNTIVTMHLSGRAQTRMFERAAKLFLDNLARYRAGEPLRNQVNLTLGY